MTLDRKPRTENVREKNSRPLTWKPPSSLDAPPPPEGYKHRWLRMEANGIDDRKNLSARLREGFELVRAEEYPEWDLPTINDGKHAGVIAVGGLVLARIPLDIVEQRTRYFQNQTREQIEAVDNDLLRDQHPSMPMMRPERQSRVSFGGNRASEKQ